MVLGEVVEEVRGVDGAEVELELEGKEAELLRLGEGAPLGNQLPLLGSELLELPGGLLVGEESLATDLDLLEDLGPEEEEEVVFSLGLGVVEELPVVVEVPGGVHGVGGDVEELLLDGLPLGLDLWGVSLFKVTGSALFWGGGGGRKFKKKGKSKKGSEEKK